MAFFVVVHYGMNLSLNEWAEQIRKGNDKWWTDLETGEPVQRNKGELIALIHSELSEALEGIRKSLQDDKLPHRTMEETEMADVFIRLMDYCGGFNLDIQGAVEEKLAYNAVREDHKVEARKLANGKKF